LAVGVLDALIDAGHDICLVVSTPDTRRGRGSTLSPSPVRKRALELGLATSDEVADAANCGAELGVVVAYGKLVPAEVLAAVPMVNLHFSLLPRWRGAAPVERAILAGDKETGVCVMALDEGLDTGPLYACSAVQIGEEERADELTDRLAAIGTGLLVDLLAAAPASLAHPHPQVGEPTYAAKIEPEDRRLDWRLCAARLARVVRVGRAFTTWRGRRLLVHRARVAAFAVVPSPEEPPGTLRADGRVVTGEGLLELVEVQAEGRSVQPIAAFLAGARIGPGERLGT
jgi:methionyl-tRNA formyltransferase